MSILKKSKKRVRDGAPRKTRHTNTDKLGYIKRQERKKAADTGKKKDRRSLPRKPKTGCIFRSFTEQNIIGLIYQKHGLVKYIAEAMDCSRANVYALLDKYPSLKKAKDDCIEDTLDLAEDKITEALKEGKPWALCYYTKCKGKHRGFVEKLVLDGKIFDKVDLSLNKAEGIDESDL